MFFDQKQKQTKLEYAMLKKAVGLLAVAMVSMSPPSHALLIDNGGSTTDTNTGLEWLDLTLTENKSYNDLVVGGFGGYIAAGYNHATTSQLCGIFGSLGDAVTNCLNLGAVDGTDSISQANADILTALLGITTTFPAVGSYGYFDGGFLGSGQLGIGCIEAGSAVPCIHVPLITFRRTNSVSFSQTDTNAGHWLVRAAVPEPATIALFSLGLAGLGFSRRRTPVVASNLPN